MAGNVEHAAGLGGCGLESAPKNDHGIDPDALARRMTNLQRELLSCASHRTRESIEHITVSRLVDPTNAKGLSLQREVVLKVLRIEQVHGRPSQDVVTVAVAVGEIMPHHPAFLLERTE